VVRDHAITFFYPGYWYFIFSRINAGISLKTSPARRLQGVVIGVGLEQQFIATGPAFGMRRKFQFDSKQSNQIKR
jgi:hypothetical protein